MKAIKKDIRPTRNPSKQARLELDFVSEWCHNDAYRVGRAPFLKVSPPLLYFMYFD